MRTAVADRGFALIRRSLSSGEFDELARELGSVIDTTVVRVDADVSTYLCGYEAVPFHTDHAEADLVAWRCLEQDEHDGACLLVDGRRIVERLSPKDLRDLTEVRLRHRGTSAIWPVVSHSGAVFFAPWLQPPTPGATSALDAFRREVGDPDWHAGIEIDLRPGQVLLIDNHRRLHGRRAISPNSERHLVRQWISTRRALKSRPKQSVLSAVTPMAR